MRLMIFICGLFTLTAAVIFLIIENTPYDSAPVRLLAIENCSVQPCLLGHSIRGASREQVEKIITDSPLSGDVTFHSGRRLNWRWSSDTAEQFQLHPQSESNWSYVALNERTAEEVRLSFVTRLEELILSFGFPTGAIPYMATQRGELHYLLIFHHIPGFFEVALTCAHTRLSPDTPVVAYLSKDIPHVKPMVNWHVYTTRLPNCSIFRP